MPFIEREAKYLLGIEQFDLHHRHLVDLLNGAYDMFASGKVEDGELQRILKELTEYSNYHFNLEENWMGQIGYPKYREHVLEHQRFIYKLHDFNKQFNEENSDLTLEIVSFLRRWLLDHIQNVDAEYGAFMLKKSPR